jgi:LacI family transcriptional regulator
MGGLQAAAHLIGRGHPRIAWMGPELTDGNTQVLERFSGAHAGLVRAGTDFSHLVEAPLGDPAGAAKAARMLLAGSDRPGAILALWQDLGAALARAAGELGLVVGRDLEMVGWCTEEEYADFCSWFPPGRVPAVVTWSIARMAEAAVARLKQRRAEPQLAPLLQRIPTTLRADGKEPRS